jgi:hypothetical protein
LIEINETHFSRAAGIVLNSKTICCGGGGETKTGELETDQRERERVREGDQGERVRAL